MNSCAVSFSDRVQAKFRGTPFIDYLDAFRYDCDVRNLSAKTIDVYHERLGYLFAHLQQQGMAITSLSRQAVQDYIMSLKGNVSDETINGRLRVYRRFFNYLVEDGLWEGDNPMANIKLLRVAKKVKPVVEPDVVQTMLKSSNRKTFEGQRNRLMLLLFWDGMLRLGELLGLRTADIDLGGKVIKVFGKGRKERIVPLGATTLRVLQQYLVRWRRKYPGDLLVCMRNGEPIKHRHCHKIVQSIGRKHGVTLYPHLLRHSAATHYIRMGGNPAVLQAIMGHTSLTVTQNYLHLSSRDAVASYEKFSPANALRV